MRQPYTNLNRWFNTLINQPQFKKVLGDFKLCDKPYTADSMYLLILFYFIFQYEFLGKKTPEVKKEKKEKEKKPAAQPENDLDDDVPLEPKPKDPFAALPKG